MIFLFVVLKQIQAPIQIVCLIHPLHDWILDDLRQSFQYEILVSLTEGLFLDFQEVLLHFDSSIFHWRLF